jgi:hypothetical protein
VKYVRIQRGKISQKRGGTRRSSVIVRVEKKEKELAKWRERESSILLIRS